jgi:uncharacterized protein (TIGR00369 family)
MAGFGARSARAGDMALSYLTAGWRAARSGVIASPGRARSSRQGRVPSRRYVTGMSSFQPTDQDFEGRVQASFTRQRMMTTLGATLERVAPGEVDIRLPFRADFTQQHGFLHAGAMTTALDGACGYAALTLMPPGVAVLTVEFKVNLMTPGKGEAVLARGRVLKAGRTLTTCTGDVFAVEGGVQTLILTMLATMMTVRDRPGFSD